MNDEKETERFAYIEIMGHQRTAGRITEEMIAGTPMLRIDVPIGDDFRTEYLNASSIYRMQPCAEVVARRIAAQMATSLITDPFLKLPQRSAAAESPALPAMDAPTAAPTRYFGEYADNEHEDNGHDENHGVDPDD